MSRSNLAKGHVHFEIENSIPRDNSIVVEGNSRGCIHVHLGFLQFQHNYRISFEIPKLHFLGHDINTIWASAEKSEPNINCKLVSFEENNDQYSTTVEFYARKEKLLKEEIVLHINEADKINIVFNARVLGQGKGTPLLKDGIKCIGVDVDDMSEASDWQGFD